MDFHDKMCILVESEDEARQLCELLTEAGIPWISGASANQFVTFKEPAVYYCFKKNAHLAYMVASGSRQIQAGDRAVCEGWKAGAAGPFL